MRRFFKPRPPRFALALQGGGAHAAFTWGVLDLLLERGIGIDALSGASAGALNATALADGWRLGGPEGAREALMTLWVRIAELAERAGAEAGELMGSMLGFFTFVFSPYDLNPFDDNPLRTLVRELFDVEALRAAPPFPLLIATTRVATGTARLFDETDLTHDVLLASTALPQLHHAVPIEDELYWDGGLVANPPVLPLVSRMRGRDLLLVRINPQTTPRTPRTAPEIRARVAEIMVGRPLADELERLAEARTLAPRLGTWLHPGLRRRARVRLHTIDADAVVGGLAPTTRLLPTRSVLLSLHRSGRDGAAGFLDEVASRGRRG